MSKVSRGDVGENKVASVLKSIKEYHYIFNNVTLKNKKSEMSHQIDHILVNSHGIIVIETKNYYGKINFDEKTKTWTSTVKGKTTQIKSPVSQNKSHAINLNNIFKGQVSITSVVVYANNNAPYIANENVINLEDLKTFLETYDFSGKKIILWATSGGSGLGKAQNDLAKSTSATIVDGRILNNDKQIEQFIKEIE